MTITAKMPGVSLEDAVARMDQALGEYERNVSRQLRALHDSGTSMRRITKEQIEAQKEEAAKKKKGR